MDHRYGKAQWGPNGTRVRTSDANWRKPLAWNRAAEKAGERHRVFCASLADVFEDWDGPVRDHLGRELFIPDRAGNPPYDTNEEGAFASITLDDLRLDLFALIDKTPNLDWLLLTKRPENVRRMLPGVNVQSQEQADSVNERGELFRQNVWIGTSVSDQDSADKQIPELLKCRDFSPVLFLSAEPLLGPIDLSAYMGGPYVGLPGDMVHQNYNFGIDWIIAGGESGRLARTCDPQWCISIVEQCRSADVPVFVKQLGARCVRQYASRQPGAEHLYHPHGYAIDRPDGSRLACHAGWYHFADGKGGDWSEWPEDLRVREFPQVAETV